MALNMLRYSSVSDWGICTELDDEIYPSSSRPSDQASLRLAMTC